jgi:hypothetical protein
MRRVKSAIVLVAVILLGAPAFADVIYNFQFTNLQNYLNQTWDDFSITLTYSDYVQATGMAPIPGPSQQTTLGYLVQYAGTNKLGYWGFDDDDSAIILDDNYSYGGSSFLFEPYDSTISSYYNSPGVYTGEVSGNAPYAFHGLAALTIRETNPVPEPISMLLFGTGLVGVGGYVKRKLKG